ncbi:type 2 periplasmic-binding domain-containing protein [Alloscardovia criceti]|uniref:extracellular solute-binding protein n=1 Tax=Alloscardovia criceti TaxID=356828 RepID=UPI000362F855|nr:extracellular solute-binding protein [Alloscardovia criceti]
MSLKKKAIAAVAAVLTTAMALSGCGSNSSSTAVDTSDDGQLMTVDVFDELANYQGIQKGWFAKIVKDKFNIELNIIAPNVAGGGSTLFDTRSAAGNLGDIIITGYGSGRGAKLVKSNLIADMTPYLDGMDYIKKYSDATDNLNSVIGQTSGVWGIPGSVSTRNPTEAGEGLEPTFGPYLRWDYYKEVGYPDINTLEDLIPVLKSMQDAARAKTGDNSIYAMSLFKDWDGNMMNNAKQPTCYYGFDERGFVLAKADGSDFESVTQKDGIYERVLKFFYAANQAGIVDPESTTQNYDTMNSKYKEGKVLFSFWPWLGQAAYNTTEHKNAGEGFMIAPLKDQKIFSFGATPDGYNTMIAIGAKAKNKSRLVKFINWLYSPEGVYDGGAQTSGSAGPQGLNWEIKDGQPVLTDFGETVLNGGTANVPDEYGGGSYTEGVSALNFPTVLPYDTDPDTGYAYSATMWPSEIEKNSQNALSQDWSEHMGGAQTTMDYLKANNMLLVAPGATFIEPDEDSQISTLRGSIKTQIVTSSWQAVFAKDESSFNQILREMESTTDGLGMDKVLEVDMANAKAQDEARKKIAEEYANKSE